MLLNFPVQRLFGGVNAVEKRGDIIDNAKFPFGCKVMGGI